jgi:hypothetical protein
MVLCPPLLEFLLNLSLALAFLCRLLLEKMTCAKELADVQAKLEEFKGAEITRFLDPNLVHPSKWANRSEAIVQIL